MQRAKEMVLIAVWILVGSVGFWSFHVTGLLPTHRQDTAKLAFEVDFPEVYQQWHKEQGLFVDARPASLFKRGHIPRAVNVPLNRLSQTEAVLPRDHQAALIVYCSNVECPNAYQLMQRLLGRGYRNVWVFPRGIQGWQALGYPLEKGE